MHFQSLEITRIYLVYKVFMILADGGNSVNWHNSLRFQIAISNLKSQFVISGFAETDLAFWFERFIHQLLEQNVNRVYVFILRLLLTL